MVAFLIDQYSLSPNLAQCIPPTFFLPSGAKNIHKQSQTYIHMNLHGHGHTRIIYIYESMYVYMSARQSVRTWRHAKLLQVLCTLLRIALWKRSQKERHSFCRWAKLQTHIRSFRTKAWRLCATKSNGPSESLLRGATGCGVEAGLGNFSAL